MSARQLTGAWAAVLAVLAAAFVASGWVMTEVPKPPRVRMAAVVDAGPSWRLAAAGAVEAARRQGIKLDVFALDEGMTAAGAPVFVDGFDGSRYDAVLIGVERAEGLRQILNALPSETRLLTFGVDAAPRQRLCHVGTNGYSVGRHCGDALLEQLPSGGATVVVLDEAADSGGDRLDGFEDCLRRATATARVANRPLSWRVAARIDGRIGDAATAERLAALAKQNPQLSYVVNLNDESSAPLTGPLAATAPLSRLTWIVCDSSEAALEAVASGRVHVAVARNSYEIGRTAVDWASLLVRSETSARPLPGTGSVYVRPEMLRTREAAAYRAGVKPGRTASGG